MQELYLYVFHCQHDFGLPTKNLLDSVPARMQIPICPIPCCQILKLASTLDSNHPLDALTNSPRGMASLRGLCHNWRYDRIPGDDYQFRIRADCQNGVPNQVSFYYGKYPHKG